MSARWGCGIKELGTSYGTYCVMHIVCISSWYDFWMKWNIHVSYLKFVSMGRDGQRLMLLKGWYCHFCMCYKRFFKLLWNPVFLLHFQVNEENCVCFGRFVPINQCLCHKVNCWITEMVIKQWMRNLSDGEVVGLLNIGLMRSDCTNICKSFIVLPA